MTADTNEALDALVAKLREIAKIFEDSGFFGGARDVCTKSADMLIAQAAKLVEAETEFEHLMNENIILHENQIIHVNKRQEYLLRAEKAEARVEELEAALRRIADLNPDSANAKTAHDLHLTVKAVAQEALSNTAQEENLTIGEHLERYHKRHGV